MLSGRAYLKRPRSFDGLAAVLSTLVALFTLLALGAVAARTEHHTVGGKAQPVAVFMGDSYVSGAGASDPFTHRFPLVIAHELKWDEVNLGIGGTGYVGSVKGELTDVACGLIYCPSFREMIPDAVSAAPDIVIVNGGRNDLDLVTDLAWAPRVTAFYAALRTALPEAVIIATSPIWDDRPVPADMQTMRVVVKEAVTAVGGIYLDLGDPLLARPHLVSSNRVLPNDAGHTAIAVAFVARYREYAGTETPTTR